MNRFKDTWLYGTLFYIKLLLLSYFIDWRLSSIDSLVTFQYHSASHCQDNRLLKLNVASNNQVIVYVHFLPRPLLGSIIFSVVAWFFQLVTLQRHQLSEAVTLGGTPWAACGSALTWRPWLCKAAQPHKPACDWLTECTPSVGAVFIWLNDLDGPGVGMWHKNLCAIVFFFKVMNSTYQNKEFCFFHLQDFPLTSSQVLSATLDPNEL